MSKRRPWQKWTLPLEIDPPRICMKIEIPDDPYHIAAFLGAVQGLASGYNWKDDPLHKARLVAKVWRDIADKLVKLPCFTDETGDGVEIEDSMNLRISPDNPCIIQCLDCNNNWTDWYDPTQCIPGIVSQPTGQGTLAPGECKSFDVTLDGNGKWRLPVPISAGYTITVSGAAGGWADGSGLWFCPNGQSYALGGCSSTPATSGSDPCPLIPHARLIAIEETGSVCHDAFNGTFTTTDTGPTNLDFQMNDPSLSDNAGSISFSVKVCAAASNCWKLTLDLTTTDGGFVPNPSVNDPSGHWVSASGWNYTDQVVTGSSDHSRAVRIRKALGGTFHVTRIDMTYDLTRGSHVPDGDQATGIGVAGHNVNFPTSNGTSLHNNGTGLSVDISNIDLTVYGDYNVGGSALDGLARITAVYIEGTGPRPAGSADC